MSTAASNSEEVVKEPLPPSCSKISTPEAKCVMCFRGPVDPVSLGDLYQSDGVTCHYYCLLLSSSLVQNGQDHEGILGFLAKDILKEARRGARLNCSYCRRKGATIGCSIKACRKTFHLPCGLEKGSMHQYFDQFLSFCTAHRPHQKVAPRIIKLLKEDEDAKICPTCYDPVTNNVSNDTLWAPCCRKRWFHRVCLQRQALAQGYFFKCPMCNNKDKFNAEMKQYGIYIPEMDAAWEREPQAFQDLLHTHKMCDARICECPDGRSSTQNTGSWRLVRCNACGSQGTHIKCSGLKMAASTNSWRCATCSRIFNKGKGRTHASFESGAARRSLSNSTSHTASRIPSPTSSPTPSTSSGSSTNNSSLRRKPVDVSFEQDRKRRKSSTISPNLDANKEEQNTSSEIESKSVSDEDEIVVVDDDSESDIEVVEVDKSTKPLRTYPVSSELLTNEGKTIKVHKVAAEGNSTPIEIGSLGSVNMRSMSKEMPKQYRKSKVRMAKESDSTHPSTSSQSHTLNVSRVPNPTSTCSSDSNSKMIDTPSQLEIKIDNVRHSNELFSATRKEDGAENPPTPAATLPTAHSDLLDYVNKRLMFPVQSIYLLPVQTADGQRAVRPYIPVTALSTAQQQQLMQAQRQLQQAPASPDVVTLE